MNKFKDWLATSCVSYYIFSAIAVLYICIIYVRDDRGYMRFQEWFLCLQLCLVVDYNIPVSYVATLRRSTFRKAYRARLTIKQAIEADIRFKVAGRPIALSKVLESQRFTHDA